MTFDEMGIQLIDEADVAKRGEADFSESDIKDGEKLSKADDSVLEDALAAADASCHAECTVEVAEPGPVVTVIRMKLAQKAERAHLAESGVEFPHHGQRVLCRVIKQRRQVLPSRALDSTTAPTTDTDQFDSHEHSVKS